MGRGYFVATQLVVKKVFVFDIARFARSLLPNATFQRGITMATSLKCLSSEREASLIRTISMRDQDLGPKRQHQTRWAMLMLSHRGSHASLRSRSRIISHPICMPLEKSLQNVRGAASIASDTINTSIPVILVKLGRSPYGNSGCLS